MKRREERALSMLRTLVIFEGKYVLVKGKDFQEEDIQEENRAIQQDEEDIYNLEKLCMIFEKYKYKNVNLEELGINFSDKMKDILALYEDTSNVDMDFLFQTDVEKTLDYYYIELNDSERIKQIYEQKNFFMSIYKQAEKEYLNNENIFDPNYVIKGIKLKKSKEFKNVSKKKTINDLGLDFDALVYLHHSGISIIDDLLSKADNTEQLKEFLNTIKGLKESDKEKIIEYITDNKYFEKKLNDNEEKSGIPIDALLLSVGAYNCLKRAGINTLGDLSNMTEKDLRKVRNIGKKFEEIVTKMEKHGVSLKTEENEKTTAENDEEIKDALVDEIIEKQEKIKSQEAEISNLKSQRRDLNE